MAIISWLSSSIFLSLFTLFCLSISNATWGAEAARESCRPISSLINKDLFHTMFLHKDDAACPAKDFYAYNSFIKASKSFPGFGTTGSLTTRKREIAAFLAQISHETSGGWATAPDGPYAWGLCFKEEINPQSDYCDSTKQGMALLSGQILQRKRPYSTILVI